MFVQHSNVYLMTASRQNCNAASLLSFLHRVVDVSTIGNSNFMSSWLYFGNKTEMISVNVNEVNKI